MSKYGKRQSDNTDRYKPVCFVKGQYYSACQSKIPGRLMAHEESCARSEDHKCPGPVVGARDQVTVTK